MWPFKKKRLPRFETHEKTVDCPSVLCETFCRLWDAVNATKANTLPRYLFWKFIKEAFTPPAEIPADLRYEMEVVFSRFTKPGIRYTWEVQVRDEPDLSETGTGSL